MEQQTRRGISRRFLPLIVVFGLGGGAGYYVRGKQDSREVERAIRQARHDAAELGIDALDRARRAGSDLGAGFEAAADSARAALRELLTPSGSDDR